MGRDEFVMTSFLNCSVMFVCDMVTEAKESAILNIVK